MISAAASFKGSIFPFFSSANTFFSSILFLHSPDIPNACGMSPFSYNGKHSFSRIFYRLEECFCTLQSYTLLKDCHIMEACRLAADLFAGCHFHYILEKSFRFLRHRLILYQNTCVEIIQLDFFPASLELVEIFMVAPEKRRAFPVLW